MVDLAQAVGDVLVGVIALQALDWSLAYQRLTGGAWRSSTEGRHLMSFMLVIAAVTGLAVVRAVAVDALGASDPAWFRGLRVAVFAGVPLVLGWRRRLLTTAQRRVAAND